MQGPELHLHMSTIQRSVLLLDVSTPQSWAAQMSTEPELHLDVSTIQMPGPIWMCLLLHHLDRSCTWTCFYYRGLCCILTCLQPEAWAASGLGWATGACAAPGRVYTKGPWGAPGPFRLLETVLLLDLSTLQRPVLHPVLSTHWGLSCIWTCLTHRDQFLITVERVRFALK